MSLRKRHHDHDHDHGHEHVTIASNQMASLTPFTFPLRAPSTWLTSCLVLTVCLLLSWALNVNILEPLPSQPGATPKHGNLHNRGRMTIGYHMFQHLDWLLGYTLSHSPLLYTCLSNLMGFASSISYDESQQHRQVYEIIVPFSSASVASSHHHHHESHDSSAPTSASASRHFLIDSLWRNE